MSSGSAPWNEKPRPDSSIWYDDSPRSSSTAVACSTPARDAKVPRCRKLPCSSTTRAPKRARRRAACTSASGSRSMPSRRVSPPARSSSCSACPPKPTVPSTSQPPRRGRERNTTSSASTGVCDAGSFWSRTLDALRGEIFPHVFERQAFTLLHVPASLIPDLEVVLRADDEHVLREPTTLAIVLWDLDASVRIEDHVESGGEIDALELTTIGIELRQLRDFPLERAPLVFRPHIERLAIGRDHETITAGLA